MRGAEQQCGRERQEAGVAVQQAGLLQGGCAEAQQRDAGHKHAPSEQQRPQWRRQPSVEVEDGSDDRGCAEGLLSSVPERVKLAKKQDVAPDATYSNPPPPENRLVGGEVD